jgi:mannose-6-phosphate isomerase
MGARPGSPSRVILPGGSRNLDELIASDPCRYLGNAAADRFGALPFLFKLLAAEKPLSIQAHPNLARAREGFERENRAALPLDAPNRNYKDANHKPEIICALSPFTGMCGFREPVEIKRLLAEFLAPLFEKSILPRRTFDSRFTEENIFALRDGFAPLLQALDAADTGAALRDFLNALFDLSLAARRALTDYILSAKSADSPEWELMRSFAHLYLSDPAVIAPLYLNIFHLEPGEAVYLDAGVLHAYCSGFGVELMANSDNVLRGGLTGKHIDIPELMGALNFNPVTPHIIKPEFPCFTYPTPCEEFSLTRIHSRAFSRKDEVETATAIAFQKGPSICIVTEGELSIGGEIIGKGESIFIPAGNEPPRAQGDYTLYIASLGLP